MSSIFYGKRLQFFLLSYLLSREKPYYQHGEHHTESEKSNNFTNMRRKYLTIIQKRAIFLE